MTSVRLTSTFPARAISVPATLFLDANFRREFCAFIATLGDKEIEKMQPQTIKAEHSNPEYRDTTNPYMVSQLLFSLLASEGRPTNQLTILKQVRDDVCWDHGLLPWRRNPFWLVMRVTAQLILCRSEGLDSGRVLYKNLICRMFARLLRQALELKVSSEEAPSECIYLINAKIARKVQKLGPQLDSRSAFFAQEATDFSSHELKSRFQKILDDCSPKVQSPPDLEEMDTSLNLSNSSDHLRFVLDRFSTKCDSAIGESSLSTWARPELRSDELPDPKVFDVDRHTLIKVLYHVEGWFEENLQRWSSTALREESYCVAIESLIKTYRKHAGECYKRKPQLLSIMYLTIFELWRALDEVALSVFPPLRKFGPGFPSGILEPCLLPEQAQMRRLFRLEEYMTKRSEVLSIFETISAKSYSVRYFKSSKQMRSHLEAIKRDADRVVKSKEKVWGNKREQYRSLMERARQQPCRFGLEDNDDENDLLEIHNDGPQDDAEDPCEHCALKSAARKIVIEKLEYPLPKDAIQAKAVVFELCCPRGFRAWRDTTWSLLADLSPQTNEETCSFTLPSYQPLKKYKQIKGRSSRVVLASRTNCYLNTHYTEPARFDCQLDDVCLPHAGQYGLWDCKRKIWISSTNLQPSIKEQCTLSLPEKAYSQLQWMTDSVAHTENDVLAAQNYCPPQLSLSEFNAFGFLRAGASTQWLNVFIELCSSSLRWHIASTKNLIQQAIWEAGCSGSAHINGLGLSERWIRDSHVIVRMQGFCDALLKAIRSKHDIIQSNWKEMHCMEALISLVSRIVAIGTDGHAEEALDVLSDLRHTVYKWVKALQKHCQNLEPKSSIREGHKRLLQACFAYKATFNASCYRPQSKVFTNVEAISSFVHCSIMIQDHLPERLPQDLQELHVNDNRLSLRMLADLQEASMQNTSSKGITAGIQRVLKEPIAVSGWKSNDETRLWITGCATHDPLAGSRRIEYNLLSGTLLINGTRVGRLPASVTSHDIYVELFGTQVIEAVKSDMPQMLYKGTEEVHGNIVHFGIFNDVLAIRIVRDGQTWELIDRKQFGDDLPQCLLIGHFHWFNLNTEEIEIRPTSVPWSSHHSLWRLKYGSEAKKATQSTAVSGDRDLLESTRPVARYFHNLFKCLELPSYILVLRGGDGSVCVELPRFRLRFYLKHGLIQCHELNAFITQDQSLQTFIGLESKLVLQDLHSSASEPSRFVLVPRGTVKCHGNEHVKVSIALPEASRLRYATFNIDSLLKRLKPPVDIESRLYQALLHALTSQVMPDPLTNRTGTEMAMRCLRDSALFTSHPLSDEAKALILEIARIAPLRKYYPRSLQVMQQTVWRSDIAWLSQHDDFKLLAQTVLDQNNRFQGVRNDVLKARPICMSDEVLSARATIRNSFVYRWSAPWTYTIPISNIYESRAHHTSECGLEQAAFETALILKDPGRYPASKSDIYSKLIRWGRIAGFGSQFNIASADILMHLDPRDCYGSLHSLCKASDSGADRWKLTFLFGILAFGNPKSSPQLQTLLGFSTVFDCSDLLNIPSGSYEISLGHEPRFDDIVKLLSKHRVPFRSRQHGETQDHYKHSQKDHAERTASHIRSIANCAIEAWPCEEPSLPFKLDGCLVKIASIKESLQERLGAHFKNMKLFEACISIDQALASRDTEMYPVVDDFRLCLPCQVDTPQDCPVLLRDLLQKEVKYTPPAGSPSLIVENDLVETHIDYCELENVIRKLRGVGGTQEKYSKGLQTSVDALKASMSPKSWDGDPPLEDLKRHQAEHANYIQALLHSYKIALQPSIPAHRIIEAAGMWPKVDAFSLLSILSAGVEIHSGWKQRITFFGRAISLFQRASRLLRYAATCNKVAYQRELANPGYEGWSPEQRPGWLLFQIEQDLLIREVQAKIAMQMIRPGLSGNAVMQMNMGEGKSSVIIPMVAIALADGFQLVRVIVLKSLFTQMEHILRPRLGGLVNRKVVTAPFHRGMKLGPKELGDVAQQCHEWEQEKSVILAQPDHVLSYKQMTIDQLSRGQMSLACQMMAHYVWLTQHCRDLLDESDEILSPNYELVYTIGSAKSVSGQPQRWALLQGVFSLAEKHVPILAHEFPNGIEVGLNNGGSFQHLRILDEKVGKTLVSLIAQDIANGRLEGLALDHCPSSLRDAAIAFIEHRDIPETIKQSIRGGFEGSHEYKGLLILRGFLAYGIMTFSLHQKRWSVDYGLALGRALSAVPYLAKDVPSATAEFGHPDCSIALTCLSYYYSGLNEQQLRQCFSILLDSADPDPEYDRWRQRASLSPALRELSGINMDDEMQWKEEVYPGYRYNKNTIDFFLAKAVFPREAKEFESKLSASGWDLATECSNNSMTGFSGTADLASLNPMSVQTLEIRELQKASAEVLNHLLRTENRQLLFACHDHSKTSSTEDLLNLIIHERPPVQLIVDVGAQVLGKTNKDVITALLAKNSNLEAGVFFDEQDTPTVLDRSGVVEPLLSSSFNGRLNNCVVFLDEAHTRGVDLDLPQDFRGAITLGPGLTKDRFVQGMSVYVIASPEFSMFAYK